MERILWVLLSASTPGSSGSKRTAFRHHGNRRFPNDPGAVALYRLYTDDAGYRHSDTVLVTGDGTEQLTYFPRALEDNIV